MKSRIGVKSPKWRFQIDQFPGDPSPRNALAEAPPNRRRLASRAICLPKSLDSAMLLGTVRTKRLGCQSAGDTSSVSLDGSLACCLDPGGGDAEATDNASVSAIWAPCLGSQTHAGGSGSGSS